MLCLDIINTMLVSMPRPSRKLRTSLWERPKVSILRTITCNRYESQRHDIVAPSETAPSCSARCDCLCTASSSQAASRECFPEIWLISQMLERSRKQAGTTFNILYACRLTISCTISFLSQSLYGILAHLKTLRK